MYSSNITCRIKQHRHTQDTARSVSARSSGQSNEVVKIVQCSENVQLPLSIKLPLPIELQVIITLQLTLYTTHGVRPGTCMKR